MLLHKAPTKYDISTSEARRLLGVKSNMTVLRYLKQGLLSAKVKKGSRNIPKFNRQELEQFGETKLSISKSIQEKIK